MNGTRTPFVYLASASPRRRALLEQIGVGWELVHVAVDETPRSGESPAEYVDRLALEKGRQGLARRARDDHPVLAADTAVVLGGEVLGKPADADAARLMLGRLAGATHEVLSAVALVDAHREGVARSRSEVTFRAIRPAEIDAYCASGEPHDKAGAYAIQGMAAVFVRELRGSYSGVMGLPLFETAALLESFGLPVLGSRAGRP